MIKKMLSVIGLSAFLLSTAVTGPAFAEVSGTNAPDCGGLGAACW